MIPNPEKARMYAGIVHAGQVYNDEVPYTHHLDLADSVAARFGLTFPDFRCAVFLHDTIEDGGWRCSFNDIKNRFGEEVARLVWAVTDERGINRDERHRKTFPKTRAAGYNAIALKLVDRIANVEYGLADKSGKGGMYAKEFREFAHALWRPEDAGTTVELMWELLARLLKKTEDFDFVRLLSVPDPSDP
jgi:(p)ppGpp synthase/HD superfamily hydrolase